MSNQEFFGMVLGLAMALAAVLFMKIAYEAARHRKVKAVLRFLKLAGFLSIGSWAVMTAALFHFGQEVERTIEARAIHLAVPAEQIASTAGSDTVIHTPNGNVIEIGDYNAGLHSVMGNFRFGSGIVGSSHSRLRRRADSRELSHAANADRFDERTQL